MRRPLCAAATLAIGLLAGASASVGAPVHLEMATGPLDLTPGATLRLEASLVNDTKADLRLQRDSALRYTIMCRGPLEPPGQMSFGTGSGFGGSIFGGIADGPEDPTDPKYCRYKPPETVVIPPGGSLPLSVAVAVPGRCAEGEGELDISFTAADDGRHCPGIWSGDLPPTTRPVTLRRPVTRVDSPSSPAALSCALTLADGAGPPRLVLALTNRGETAWRATVVPSIELMVEGDLVYDHWATFDASERPRSLSSSQAVTLEIPAGGEWRREIALDALAWGKDVELWPGDSLASVEPGSYTVKVPIEVLGGRSWELSCPSVEVKLPAH